MQLDELGYWLVVAGLLVVLPFLVQRWPLIRGKARAWLKRVGVQLVEWLRPEPQVDQVALDLFRVLRREKLRSDVQRLQRILATDSNMSATRQIANRLAYEWLLRELRDVRGGWSSMGEGASYRQPASDPVPTDWRAGWATTEVMLDDWRLPAQPVKALHLVSERDSQRAPEVEVLELGWRR